MRNYCAGYYDESTGKVNFWIQAEKEVGVKGTMGYLIDVPKLVFGQAGYHLYHQNKKNVLNDLYQPQPQQPFFHHHQQQSALPPQPDDGGNSAFHRLQSKIGGFVMPQANN